MCWKAEKLLFDSLTVSYNKKISWKTTPGQKIVFEEWVVFSKAEFLKVYLSIKWHQLKYYLGRLIVWIWVVTIWLVVATIVAWSSRLCDKRIYNIILLIYHFNIREMFLCTANMYKSKNATSPFQHCENSFFFKMKLSVTLKV